MINVKVDRPTPPTSTSRLPLRSGGRSPRKAKPGERLPPAKDLAAVLGVNTNTVLRSLRLLREEGLLEFRRGRGVSVAGTPERGAVVQRAKELVAFARQQGYRVDELVEIIKRGELRKRSRPTPRKPLLLFGTDLIGHTPADRPIASAAAGTGARSASVIAALVAPQLPVVASVAGNGHAYGGF